MRFRATLNFRKFKVALNRVNIIFLNFAKSCILSCLSKFYNKKKIHYAVFKLVDTRSVGTCFLRGPRYANVSLTHSGVDTVRY